MTARVEVLMSVKDSEAVQAWQRSKNSIGAFMDELGKIPAMNQRIETSGKRVWEQTRTPLERFKAEVKNLAELFQAGAIDQDTYSRGVQRQNDLLAKAEQAMVKVDAAQQALQASGQQVFQQTRTPAEQYATTMARLNELLQKGAIDTDTFARAQLQAKTALDASDESLKRATADNQRLEQAARRVFDSTRTPLEKYNAEMDHLDELLQKGKIDQDSYNRAAAQAVSILKSTDEGLKKVAADNQQLQQSGKAVWESTRTPLEKYNAEVAKLDNLLKKQVISDETHRRAVEKQKQAYEQSEQAGKSFFGGISSGTLQALTAFTGIGSVIGGIAAICAVVRAEYDNLLQRQKTAADKQIDTAGAQRLAIMNLGTDKTYSADKLSQEIGGMSGLTGVSQKDLYAATASSLSARGNLSVKDSLDAVQTAATLIPDDPGGLSTLAGSLLDLQKKSGGSSKQNAGMMIGGMQASRVVNMQSYAKNVIPAVFQLQDFGDTQQESMALMATLTQSMGDVEGSTAGTASIQLAKQLQQALPKMKSTTERIRYLQSEQGAGLRKKLLGSGKTAGTLVGEAKAYTTYQGLLSGNADSTQRQLYETSFGAVPTADQGEAIFNNTLSSVNSQGIQQTAKVSRALGTAAERASMRDLQGGMSGATREGLQKLLQAQGVSKTAQNFIGTQFDAATQLGGQNPLEFAAKEAERRGKDLQTAIPDSYVSMGEFDSVTPGRDRTAQEKAQGQELIDLANLLRSQIEIQKQQLAAQQEANKKQDKPTEVKVTLEGQGGKSRTATANLPAKPRPAEVLNAQGGR